MSASRRRVHIAGRTYDLEQVRIDQTWFNDGEDNGTAPSSGTTQLEWAEFEVGQDNQAAEYDIVMVGQSTDRSRDDPGKAVQWNLADHASSTQDTVPPGLVTKAVVRARSKRDGDEVFNFGPHSRLNETTPSEQVKVPPQPVVAQHGKVLALHSRDPSGNDGVNRAESSVEIHGWAGFQVS